MANLVLQRPRRRPNTGQRTRGDWHLHLWAGDYLTQFQKSSAIRASWHQGNHSPRLRKRREEPKRSLLTSQKSLTVVSNKLTGIKIQQASAKLNLPKEKLREQAAKSPKLEWRPILEKCNATRSSSMKPLVKQRWWLTMTYRVQSQNWASMIGWSSLWKKPLPSKEGPQQDQQRKWEIRLKQRIHMSHDSELFLLVAGFQRILAQTRLSTVNDSLSYNSISNNSRCWLVSNKSLTGIDRGIVTTACRSRLDTDSLIRSLTTLVASAWPWSWAASWSRKNSTSRGKSLSFWIQILAQSSWPSSKTTSSMTTYTSF